MIEQAKQELLKGHYSIAVIKDGKTAAAQSGEGIRPLLSIYRETPDLLKGAVVADKVIGKAAAAILALSGVKEVFGGVMSETALKLLAHYGIPYHYGELVDHILNRRGDGMCPMEQTVFSCESREEAFEALMSFINAQKK